LTERPKQTLPPHPRRAAAASRGVARRRSPTPTPSRARAIRTRWSAPASGREAAPSPRPRSTRTRRRRPGARPRAHRAGGSVLEQGPLRVPPHIRRRPHRAVAARGAARVPADDVRGGRDARRLGSGGGRARPGASL